MGKIYLQVSIELAGELQTNKYTVKYFEEITCEHKIMTCKLSIIGQDTEQDISVYFSLRLSY